MSEQFNHIDRCLKIAAEAEEQKDYKRRDKFLALAEKFEKGFESVKEMDMEREKNKNKLGGF